MVDNVEVGDEAETARGLRPTPWSDAD